MSDSNLLTQNTNESSIILLEGAIESLLKEQQQLKSKLFSQEKVISLLVREQTQDASSSNMVSKYLLKSITDLHFIKASQKIF